MYLLISQIQKTDNEILQLVKSKQKSIAWFVSHCNTFSGRDELVRKLQGFIDVDVYGKCGKMSCPKSSNQCSEMLNTTYKFYLSFENTLCIDYLTEKLYNAIQHYVIPIIFSGAEISRFLPPRSYINANDFETTEDLANYLEFLQQNVNEYLKYFWWKKHYKIIRSDHIELCKICLKLNEPGFATKRQTYVSIKDWFFSNTCKKPKIKF
jgi:alpha-1,3-fucosyltransferase